MKDEPFNAYVLWYSYWDKSGSGVLRTYLDEERAKEDFRLLEGVCDSKEYKLSTVPLCGDKRVGIL